jgi:hypothetical protein
MLSQTLKCFFLCLLTVVVVLILAQPLLKNLLISDELDYQIAIEQGFFANYLETKSISTYSFFDQGFNALLFKTDIKVWQTMSANGDVLAARHFHGPFSFYSYMLVSDLKDSQALRYVSLC